MVDVVCCTEEVVTESMGDRNWIFELNSTVDVEVSSRDIGVVEEL